MAETYLMGCKLVGESYPNADGSSRQDEIALCKVGDKVTLKIEDDNPHDKDAVAVISGRGVQIGYLSRDDNREARDVIAEERVVNVEICAIYGGKPDKPNYGVEIDIECVEEDDVLAAVRSVAGQGGSD